MQSLRFWTVVLALTCFGAGLGAGSFLSLNDDRGSVEAKPFAAFRQRFVQRFELSAERAEGLDQLLANYARSIEDLEQKYLARSMSEMDKELEELGVQYHEHIRDSVLPRHRRAEFDALSQARLWAPVQL